MRRPAWLLIAALCAWPPAAGADQAMAARDEAINAGLILLRADEVRNPQMDYSVIVKVISTKPSSRTKAATYEVLVKGRDKTLIRTLSPSIERGRLLLMRDNDLWAYIPTVSKPLRVSLRERLIGDVANGDLARANFAGDYIPSIIGEEPAEGGKAWIMELLAATKDVTYGRVVLRVQQNTCFPLKAEFYAVSGRLLKTCTYGRYRKLAGRLRPSQLIMTDATNEGQQSTLEYAKMTIEELPDKMFTKDAMKRLSK